MGRYIEGVNPNQMMFGFSIEDMVEEDNPVRAIKPFGKSHLGTYIFWHIR